MVHAAQAVLIVLIANDFSTPVTAVFQDGPPGQDSFGAQTTLFDLHFGYAIAAFLGLAAIDHVLVGLGPNTGASAAGETTSSANGSTSL